MSADRAATILARFNAVHHDLISTLRRLDESAVQFEPEGGWNAAQIACHVALTNEWIAGILSGGMPLAQPSPEGFVERFDMKALPQRLKTSAALEPPAIVSLEAAVDKLRASGHHLSKAIASLSVERGRGYCVILPFATLSLFELAEFAAAHVTRHVGQVERTAARAWTS
jgi:hypothetical protein